MRCAAKVQGGESAGGFWGWKSTGWSERQWPDGLFLLCVPAMCWAWGDNTQTGSCLLPRRVCSCAPLLGRTSGVSPCLPTCPAAPVAGKPAGAPGCLWLQRLQHFHPPLGRGRGEGDNLDVYVKRTHELTSGFRIKLLFLHR